MLQIAICDNDSSQLKHIQMTTERYLEAHNNWQIQISSFDNSLLFLEKIDAEGGYDIVLLDICMPGLSGIDIAKEIRRRGDKTDIIFLTISDEFAVAAFSLKATHYLLKPFTQEAFAEAMDRALTDFSNTQSRKLLLRQSRGIVHTAEIDNILCVESYDHEQQVYFKDRETLTIRESLSGLLTQLNALSPGQFISPYKGYIVNFQAVCSVEPNCMKLYGGKNIPIVHRNYRALLSQFFDYTFNNNNQGG